MHMSRTPLPTKPCARCGRTITWRKAWERDWATVRWCSDNCRKHGLTPVDLELEDALTKLVRAHAASATVDPSEAARAVGGADWEQLVEPARNAARRLVAAGRAQIIQGGRVIDPDHAKGPITVRRPR